MLTTQVLGLELKQEILRMVLGPPKLGTHSSSLTPSPALDSAGNCKELGQNDCYCGFYREATTCPDGWPAAWHPSQAHSGISACGHCHPHIISHPQPGHKLPSDRPQALREAC